MTHWLTFMRLELKKTYMSRPAELRKSKRYYFAAPVSFMWASDGKSQSGEGVTHNVNTYGAYIVTDLLPVVGAFIQMEIVLPRISNSRASMCLQGEGVVLRTESPGARGMAGFALQVQFYPAATGSFDSHFDSYGPIM